MHCFVALLSSAQCQTSHHAPAAASFRIQLNAEDTSSRWLEFWIAMETLFGAWPELWPTVRLSRLKPFQNVDPFWEYLRGLIAYSG